MHCAFFVLYTSFIALVVHSQPTTTTSEHFSEAPYPLIAGQTIKVGEVSISQEGNQLTIEYEIENGGTLDQEWFMTAAQVNIMAQETSSTDTPSQGRCAPGRFNQNSNCPFTETSPFGYSCAVDVSSYLEEGISSIQICAHATGDMVEGGPSAVNWTCTFPCVNEQVSTSLTGGPGNYRVRITGCSDLLADSYRWYCIDKGHFWANGESILLDPYGDLPEELLTGTNPNIDDPTKLPNVNYIINNYEAGVGGFTYNHIQDAIWYIIDDNPDPCTGNCLIIANDALENGNSYVPIGPDAKLAVILLPVDSSGNIIRVNNQVTISQVTIAELTALCGVDYVPGRTDTAWGLCDVPGKSRSSPGDYESCDHCVTGWGQCFDFALESP